MRLQSAIFDLDGTLLDTASFWEQLCLDLLKQYGADPEPGVGALVSAMSPKEGAAYCKEHYHLTASLEEILGRSAPPRRTFTATAPRQSRAWTRRCPC